MANDLAQIAGIEFDKIQDLAEQKGRGMTGAIANGANSEILALIASKMDATQAAQFNALSSDFEKWNYALGLGIDIDKTEATDIAENLKRSVAAALPLSVGDTPDDPGYSASVQRMIEDQVVPALTGYNADQIAAQLKEQKGNTIVLAQAGAQAGQQRQGLSMQGTYLLMADAKVSPSLDKVKALNDKFNLDAFLAATPKMADKKTFVGGAIQAYEQGEKALTNYLENFQGGQFYKS